MCRPNFRRIASAIAAGSALSRDAGSPVLPCASLVLIGLGWVVPFLQPYHRYPLTAFYSEWLGAAILWLRDLR